MRVKCPGLPGGRGMGGFGIDWYIILICYFVLLMPLLLVGGTWPLLVFLMRGYVYSRVPYFNLHLCKCSMKVRLVQI